MKAELLDILNALRREMDNVFIPLLANDDEQRDLSDQCQEVKRDMLAVVDRKIREIERM